MNQVLETDPEFMKRKLRLLNLCKDGADIMALTFIINRAYYTGYNNATEDNKHDNKK